MWPITTSSNRIKNIATDLRIGSIRSILAACVLAAGCSGETSKTHSQSLATVSGTDITVHQLNQELEQAAALANPAQRETLQKRALEALIDRQVMADAAIAAKLDRDPTVMQKIERAKAQILAQSYVQERAASVARPSAVEIEQFYAKHPELFARRKLFDMHQLVMAPSAFDAEIKKAVDDGASLENIAQRLDTRNVPYRRMQRTRTTAQLPSQLVSGLDTLPKGQAFVVREPGQVTVATLSYLKDVPVTAQESSQEIARFLLAEKQQAALKAEVARLRVLATINYPNSKVKPTAAAQAEQSSQTSRVPVLPSDDAHIERGVAGLR